MSLISEKWSRTDSRSVFNIKSALEARIEELEDLCYDMAQDIKRKESLITRYCKQLRHIIKNYTDALMNNGVI